MEITLTILARLFFGVIVLAMFYFVIRQDKKTFAISDFFRTFLGFFSLGMIVVHSLIPLLQLWFTKFERLSKYSFEISFQTLVYCIIYYIVFVVSYAYLRSLLCKDKPKNCYLPNIRRREYINLLLLILPPALFSIIYILNIVLRSDLAELLINRIELFRGLGGIMLLSNLMIFIALYSYMMLINDRNIRNLTIYMFLVLLMLIVFTSIGSRNSFFIFILTNLTFAVLLNRKISFGKVTLYSVALLLFFTIVGFLRVRLGHIENIQIIESLTQNILGSLVSVFGTDEMLRYMFDKKFDDWQFGSTYVSSILNFVPRLLWEEKPLGGGPILTNFISPGSYELGRSNISSYTTGLLAEAYMNFGVFGIFIVSPIHAFIGVSIERIKTQNFFSLCLKSYFLVLFGFAIFYSEFLGLLARALYVSMPVVFAMFLVKKKLENEQ